jgi:streptogramin lyase
MKNFISILKSFLFLAVIYFAASSALSIAGTIDPFMAGGLLIFTAPGGAATAFSFNMTYLPEFLTYNPGANPLTSLRVETQEDGVLHDWNAAAIAAMNNFMKVGTVTANDVNLRLSDGELRPKNVTISGVTSAAGAVPFYVVSDNVGTIPFKSSNAAILALNPTRFEKFTALFIPALATATDYAEIEYYDGHKQRWEMEDIRRRSSDFQQIEGIIINNVNGLIKAATIRAAALTPCYILSVFIKGQ